MLKFKLSDGTTIESPSQIYTVDFFGNGKWNILKVFSPEKWAEAKRAYEEAKREYIHVRLQQCY